MRGVARTMSHIRSPIRLMGMSSVIVIGAGYAGVLAANRLAGLGHEVTVVNERDQFVDRIRLHEVIAGTRTLSRAHRPLASMLRGPRLQSGRAVRVEEDAAGVHVDLADGGTLTAAHGLIATGSSAGTGNWDWAVAARNSIAHMAGNGSVAVTGAGLTGLEVAAELAESRPDLRVTLVDPVPIGETLLETGRTHLASTLTRLGIATSAGPVDADAAIDCTGFTLDPLGAASGLPLNRGRIDTDEYFRVRGHTRLWACGDAARVSSQAHLTFGCASASPMAALAATQIDRASKGRPLKPASLGYVFRCISLGRRDALIQFLEPSNTPRPLVLTGRPAALFKESICRIAAAAPVHLSRRYPVFAGPRS